MPVGCCILDVIADDLSGFRIEPSGDRRCPQECIAPPQASEDFLCCAPSDCDDNYWCTNSPCCD